MKSIVFPAIGAGVLGYPPETVIKLLHSAISSFSAKFPNRNLRSVRCVVYDKLTYDVSGVHSDVKQLLLYTTELLTSVRALLASNAPLLRFLRIWFNSKISLGHAFVHAYPLHTVGQTNIFFGVLMSRHENASYFMFSVRY